MILVCGATGNVGGSAVRHLLAAGLPVRALTRDPARARLPAGVEVVRGDLRVPESLAAAVAGVDRAFLLAEAGQLPEATRNFLGAAQRAGVRHVVLNSSWTLGLAASTAIARFHRDAEDLLKASGLEWTLLRPGNFASNALRWAGSIQSQGAVFGLGAHHRSAVIDPEDIGAVAAAALAGAGHHGKTYVLTGPEVLTPVQQVEQIGAAIGKVLRFVEVPEAAARAGMVKSGTPEALVDAVLELQRALGAEAEAQRTTTVREVTGRDARRFATWAQEHRAAFSP